MPYYEASIQIEIKIGLSASDLATAEERINDKLDYLTIKSGLVEYDIEDVHVRCIQEEADDS